MSSATRPARDRSASRGRCRQRLESDSSQLRAPGRDRSAARRGDRDRRRAPDADGARGRPGWPSRPGSRHREARLPPRSGRTGTSAPRPRSTRVAIPVLASGRRIPHRYRSDTVRVRSADRRPREAHLRRRRCSTGRRRAWCSRPAGKASCEGWRSGLPDQQPSGLHVQPGSAPVHCGLGRRPGSKLAGRLAPSVRDQCACCRGAPLCDEEEETRVGHRKRTQYRYQHWCRRP